MGQGTLPSENSVRKKLSKFLRRFDILLILYDSEHKNNPESTDNGAIAVGVLPVKK